MPGARSIHSSLLVACAALYASGCADPTSRPATPANDLFVAQEVRLHRVFTRIGDWTGDGRPDGIEALVELRDQFGDTCKGAGTFLFELHEFRRDQPDPRGKRLGNPWLAEVLTPEQQTARWSKTARAYSFRLQSDTTSRGGTYAMNVTFTPTVGPRAFDRVVLGSIRPDVEDAQQTPTPSAASGNPTPEQERPPGDPGTAGRATDPPTMNDDALGRPAGR